MIVLAKQRKDLKNDIKYQVLYYPATEHNSNNESYRLYGQGFMLTKEATKYFDANYHSELAVNNVLRSPGLATTEELQGLPPALLVVAEADVLRTGKIRFIVYRNCANYLVEGEEYGRKLSKAGVPVTSIRVNGVIHGFMSITPVYDEGTLAIIDMTTAALRRVFNAKK